MSGRTGNFLQERLPLLDSLKRFGEESLPPGVGWGHTLGSVLLFLLGLQLLTGVALALYYVPAPEHAWESLDYLGEVSLASRLIRDLHTRSTTFLIVVLTLHLLRVVFHAAYRRPRELNWISGILLLLVVLALGFTGELLSWDQQGYWSTKVGIEMVHRLPLVGPGLARILSGGEEITRLTLTRFYALHALILPGILLTLVGFHLYLQRRHGPALPPGVEAKDRQVRPFYPHQLFKDSLAVLVVFLGLMLLALFQPVESTPKADPADPFYDPRPAWYFLAHYQLLRWFEGMEIVPILILPGLLLLFFLALPFWDRKGERLWRERKRPVASVLVLVGLLYGTMTYSKLAYPPIPGGDVTVSLDELPLPVQGDPETLALGRRVFQSERCVNCHRVQGIGGRLGPELTRPGEGYDREYLRRQILHPEKENPATKMPSYQGKLSPREVEAVVEYVWQLNETPVPPAKQEGEER